MGRVYLIKGTGRCSCVILHSPVGGPLEEQLEARLAQAKEELTAAGMKLSILVKTFRQSQLYLAPTRAANITGEAGESWGGGRGSMSGICGSHR